MFDLELSAIVTYNPSSVSTKTTLSDLVCKVDETDFHHWPVVDDEGNLAGIVSDLDVVRAVEERLTAMAAIDEGVTGSVRWEPCLVEDIMSRKVVTVEHNDSPKKSLRMLIDHRIRSLPVVDDGRLIAILTTTDFIRELSYGHVPLSRDSVAKFMIPPPESIDVETTVDEAYAMFHMAESEYICILKGDFPLGVVSRRDIRSAKCRETTRRILDNEFVADGPRNVAQVVQQSPTVMPGQSMFEAASILLESRKQAIAVVNRANRLMGVITEDHILRSVLYDGLVN